jgi:AraC-like DNA-binding protein
MNLKLNNIQNWHELAREANWSAATLAKLCGVSHETLRRHFIQQKGKTPGVWLAEQRQYKAMELLRQTLSVKETAACLGYKQQTNFTRKFKGFFGVCPSQWRSSDRTQTAGDVTRESIYA